MTYWFLWLFVTRVRQLGPDSLKAHHQVPLCSAVWLLCCYILLASAMSNKEMKMLKHLFRAWDKYLIKPFPFFFIYSDRERQRLHSGHSEEAERQICAADFHLLGADDKEESRRHATIHRQTSTKVSWTFLLREKFIEASTFWKWWHEC